MDKIQNSGAKFEPETIAFWLDLSSKAMYFDIWTQILRLKCDSSVLKHAGDFYQVQ